MTLPEESLLDVSGSGAPVPDQAADGGHALDIQVVTDGDRTIASFSGELDLIEADDAAACLDALVRSGVETLVIDLTELTFLDSRGISVLVQTWTAVRDAGGRMLVRASRTAMATLTVAGLDKVFEFEP